MNNALASSRAGETNRQTRPPEEGFVLGIDVGGTKLALATADLDGNRLLDDELPTLADQGAPAVISRLLEAARGLITRTSAAGGGELLAVGAVSPGIVLHDRVLLAPNNPGWSTLALAAELRAGLDIGLVAVDTDAKAAVLAEARWGTLAGVDNGAFLNLGTGVSLAAIVHGHVLRGAHGAAGEIGYHLIGRPSEAAFAEGHAPLEEHVGGGPLGARVSVLIGRRVTVIEAFELAESDSRVKELLNEALDTLAVDIANVAITLDLERIAIGGGLIHRSEWLERLDSLVRRAVPFPPDVVVARFSQDAPLAGAVVHALDRAEQQSEQPTANRHAPEIAEAYS
jgi:glucokinase